MALSAEDEQLLADMRQREFSLKKRRRAASAMFYEKRRFQRGVIAGCAIVVGLALGLTWLYYHHELDDPFGLFMAHLAWPAGVVGLVLGSMAGALWWHTSPGRRQLKRRSELLEQKYSGDLHAGRRWQQFYYQGEDISSYIPQVLYLLEGQHSYASIDEALAFAKENSYQSERFRKRGLKLFNEVAAETDLIVLSTTDENGQPSSRFMRFVRTETPGIWYVTSAPDAPKVHEFDRGAVALITAPNESGATISSNHARLRRAGKSFLEVADLYRAQIPRYLEGMTPEDQACELVYELVIDSAKVSNWVAHELVIFDHDSPGSAPGESSATDAR